MTGEHETFQTKNQVEAKKKSEVWRICEIERNGELKSSQHNYREPSPGIIQNTNKQIYSNRIQTNSKIYSNIQIC